MKPDTSLNDNEYIGSVRAYVVGFVLSIIITLVAFWLIVNHIVSGWPAALIIIVLAIVQAYIQLIFFLHLNKSDGTLWRLATFLFALSLIIVIGGGSVWIMHDLDGRMMDTPEMIEYMHKEQGL